MLSFNKKEERTALIVISIWFILSPFIAVYWLLLVASKISFIIPLHSLLWLTYFLLWFSLPALLFALILGSILPVVTGRSIGYRKAFIIGILSLAFASGSVVIINSYQFGNDELVFLGGLFLSLGSSVILALKFSTLPIR